MARVSLKTLYAFLLSVVPTLSHALGLGDVLVHSALNQPLTADIEVVGLESDTPRDSVSFKIASNAMFAKAGLDRPQFLNSIRLNWQTDAQGKTYIRLSSKEPMKEPYLNFLIEIDWPNGQIVREYTVLLNPPLYDGSLESSRQTPSGRHYYQSERKIADVAELEPPEVPIPEDIAPDANLVPLPELAKASQPVAVIQPAIQQAAPVTQTIQRQQEPVKAIAQPKPIAQKPAEIAPQAQNTSSTFTHKTYLTKQGEGLWRLATNIRPDRSIPVPTMMKALFAANPKAFLNNDVNGLMAGQQITIPTKEDIQRIDRGGQPQQLAAQVEQKQEMKLATQPAAQPEAPIHQQAVIPPATTPLIEQHDDLAVTSEPPAEKNAAIAQTAKTPVPDHLKLVVPEEGEDNTKNALTNSTNAQGNISAIKQELSMAKEALETVHRQNEVMQNELSLVRQQIQSLQALLEIKKAEIIELKDMMAAKLSSSSEAAVTPIPEPAKTDPAPISQEWQPQPPDNTTSLLDIKTNTETPKKKLFLTDSLFDLIISMRLSLLAIVVGSLGLALLCTLLMYRYWHKRQEAIQRALADEVENDPLFNQTKLFPEEPEVAEGRLFVLQAEVPEESLQADQHDVQTAIDEPDQPEEDQLVSESDPLLDANKYIAKSRYDDAQELLIFALKARPHDENLRLKLLEVYAYTNKLAQFDMHLRELPTKMREENPGLWLEALTQRKKTWPNESLPQYLVTLEESSAEVVPLHFDLPEVADFPQVEIIAEELNEREEIQQVAISSRPKEQLTVSTEETVEEEVGAGIDADADVEEYFSNLFDPGEEESTTKLKLAKAYMEMGDPEGAKSILEEVVIEGNHQQKLAAAELMAKFASY